MSNDFNDLYSSICKKKDLKLKVKAGRYNDLAINAHQLEELEWKTVLQALSRSKTLHSLKITSRDNSRKIAKVPSKTRPSRENVEDPPIMRQPLLGCLFVTIGKLLFNSEILTSLQIDGFPICIESLNLLCSGLKKCTILQHLAFPNCSFEDKNKELQMLCRLVASHTGIRSFDLSNCEIDYEGAEYIAKMIKSLRLVRTGELWKQSLRYREPDPELFPGLRRITLNKNRRIGDSGFNCIANEVIDDLWLKAIDFKDCGITIDSAKNISYLVRINNSIRVLDLRDNDLPTEFINNVQTILKERNSDCDMSYMSINSSTTTLSKRLSTTSTATTNTRTTDRRFPNVKKSVSSVDEITKCEHFEFENDLQRVYQLIDTVNRLKTLNINKSTHPTSLTKRNVSKSFKFGGNLGMNLSKHINRNISKSMVIKEKKSQSKYKIDQGESFASNHNHLTKEAQYSV